MALNATQKVTSAEITRETYQTINSLASSLITEQETAIIAYIALWNDAKNDVDLEINVDGVSLKGQRLLNAITARVRKHFGLSLYSSEVNGSSGSIRTMTVF